MNKQSALRRAGAATIIAAALALGCATPKPEEPPPEPVAAPAPPPPAEPELPPIPNLPPKELKALAQKQALESLDLLQNGDEAGAKKILELTVRIDPNNELARKLLEQIRADALQELGEGHFRYTIQPDDSLSKLAQRFLGDRFRFYILAKYNEISVPNRVAVGQVVKIPGKEPPKHATPAKAPAKPVEAKKSAEVHGPVESHKPAEAAEAAPKAKPVPPVEPPPPPPPSEAERLYAQGVAQRRGGNAEAAYKSFGEAARREPGYRDAAQQRDAIRRELVDRYHKEATAAYHRQDLDLAIRKWDQVLQLDPGNDLAKLNRARALDLKERIQKFGK